MSKYKKVANWKELPRWDFPEDYLFTSKLSLHQFLWEFVRRSPQYREDYAIYVSSQTVDGISSVYNPPRNTNESEQAWMQRVSTEAGPEPTKTPATEWLQKRWYLRIPLNPLMPAAVSPIFQSQPEFPRTLRYWEELEDLPVTEHESMPTKRPIDYTLAVAVFDYTKPLEPQISQIAKLLSKEKRLLLNAGLLKKSKQTRLKQHMFWVRHLRALDALRTLPKPCMSDIGLKLYEDAENDEKPMDRRGYEICKNARDMMATRWRGLSSHPDNALPPLLQGE